MAQGLSVYQASELEDKLSSLGLDKDDIRMVVNLVDGLKGNKFNNLKDVTSVVNVGVRKEDGFLDYDKADLAETTPIEMLEVLLLR